MSQEYFRADNVSALIEQAKNDRDHSLFLLIGEIDEIRKKKGHYVWAFPIKWRDKNGETYKESFGYEIEFEDGKNCMAYGYSGEPEIKTYYEALQEALNFLNRIVAAQECDASKAESSTDAGSKNKNLNHF